MKYLTALLIAISLLLATALVIMAFLFALPSRETLIPQPAAAQAPPEPQPEEETQSAPSAPGSQSAEVASGRVQSMIHVRSQPVRNSRLPDPADFNPREFEILKATQAALLGSIYVLTPALEDERVAAIIASLTDNDPEDWLAEHLEITFPDNAAVMQVELSGGDPEELAIVLDTIVDTYLDRVVYMENNHQFHALQNLRQRRIRSADEIHRKHTALTQARSDLGELAETSTDVAFLALELEVLQDSFRDLSQRIEELDIDLAGPSRVELLQRAKPVE